MAKLLVYDDDTTYREQIEKSLGKHEAIFVETVDEVMSKLGQEQFDAVVANVAQENENVLGLLQRAKTGFYLQKVPFICFRGPDADDLKEMDETLSMGVRMLGARAYIATDDYKSLAPALEKLLKQERPKEKGRKRR
ncbi:MAG TPA: hypothetical protein V6C81_22615 [Planktothrix sp.]|jgi:PleD family two-component response regulator